MEKMSRQEKILIILALVLCAALVVYIAVGETRAQPQTARLNPGFCSFFACNAAVDTQNEAC